MAIAAFEVPDVLCVYTALSLLEQRVAGLVGVSCRGGS